MAYAHDHMRHRARLSIAIRALAAQEPEAAEEAAKVNERARLAEWLLRATDSPNRQPDVDDLYPEHLPALIRWQVELAKGNPLDYRALRHALAWAEGQVNARRDQEDAA